MHVSPMGTKSAESLSVNPSFLPVSVAASFSVEIFWLKLPLTQFEDQATNRPLTTVLEECEDSATTQEENVKKTPAKMLLSNIACVDYMHFCCKCEIKIEYQWLVF